MNEININIEGFNVNGICVGCLNYNRKMFYSNNVIECFRILGNIEVPDGLSIQVCWECLAHVRRVFKFRKQIKNAYYLLMEYSRQHTFLNSPEDLSKHATQYLMKEEIFTLAEPLVKDLIEVEIPGDKAVVKEEVEFSEDDVKYEDIPMFDDSTIEDVKDDSILTPTNDYEPNISQESEDENIQLSMLKKKKDKREKKKKKLTKSRKKERKALQLKNYRKLKNLPEDIVVLYDMTEEKMWETRKNDVVNPGFLRLKYKCEDCIIGFNTLKLMNDHMAGKHLPKSKTCHQCDVCKSYFLTKDNVSVHRALHLAGYHCKLCGFSTGLKRLIMTHITEYHKDQKLDDMKWPCSLCNKVFSTKSKMSYHRHKYHQARPQCDCCGKVFANKMTLKYHLKVLPNDKSGNKPKENLFLPCKGCDKVFHSRKSYKAHVVIHEGLEYPCPVCGKLFQWKRNLARHIRNHTEKETGLYYECKPCRKRFSSKDCYNNHMKFSKKHVSMDNYNHECSYCGKKFPTKWCMIDHIDWDHLKKIKYQCQTCLKAFKTAKIMVAHINNIHEGKRNKEPDGQHLCDICGKYYKTVKRLKGHVWAMHTHRSTTKTYNCELCPALFTWQTSIYKHMKMMHGNPKKGKQSRPMPHAKKIRTDANVYAGAELANRMPYFPHNTILAGNLTQNIVQQTGLSNIV